MPDCGLGGCDGHHEMVDLKLRKNNPHSLAKMTANMGFSAG
jgi:hypothetical protein